MIARHIHLKIWLLFEITFFAVVHAQPESMTRAIYVTRWDYKNPADLHRIIDNAAALRFNTILFQVRGDGTVCYRSKIEPRFAGLNNGLATSDPLQIAIDYAHGKNIALHAWINVYPAWMGTQPPTAAQQLYNAHPEWIMTDEFGQQQKLNRHYIFLSPTHPEVTPYLLSVCAELYQNYDIDGIHLDYVRFPSPAYSYDDPSLTGFIRKFRTTPQQNPSAWNDWRRDAISDFIAKLYQRMKQDRPQISLTASVIGDHPMAYRVYLQDSHAWLARGIIDAIFPMIYTGDDTLFENRLYHHLLNSHDRHVYPSIYVGNASALKRQLRLAERHGCQGVALFSYELLFPNHRMNQAFKDVLSDCWQTMTSVSPMPWKSYLGDNQGPTVEEVYTLPKTLFAGSEFKIAAKITDPSGVYDDKTGSDGQGIYLIYDQHWPPRSGVEVKMSPLKNVKDWYITDRAIPAQKMGLDFRFRIFAYDDYHESAGHPKRNLGYSDVWSLSIFAKDQTFICKGAFGPLLYNATTLALDDQKKIWVGSDHEDALVVLDGKGKPMPFSPIRSGLNHEMQLVPIAPVVALAFCPPQTMCVISASYPKLVFRYDTRNGSALQGLSLPFVASGIDCDAAGHLFILEEGSTVWHVTTSLGTELLGSPFGIDHSGNDLAVLDDGSRVFISDRTTGGVQCWHGAIEGLRARYWRENDLPAVDVGSSQVAHDSSDFVYVPHGDRGVITIFNRSGRPLQHLFGGTPPLNAPIGIAATAQGDSLFVLENAGSGPTRLSL